MAVEFTEDQKKVIETKDRNILVSAAAGSGKTQVLTQRILRTISDTENPVDIDHMLVVTFTEAAAAEMKERISKAISQKLVAEPGNAHLARQNVLIHRAFITTIDSFCKYVVDNHFGEIGIDPGMRILDGGEQELIMRQVIADMFEEYYTLDEGDESARMKREGFLYCVEALSDYGDDTALKDLVLKIYGSSQSFPWPDEWLSTAVMDYKSSSMSDSAWLRYLLDDAKMTLDGVVAYEMAAHKLACQEAELVTLESFLNNELEDMIGIADMPIFDDQLQVYTELSHRIREYAFKKLDAGRGLSDEAKEQKEVAKKWRDAAKKSFQDLRDNYFSDSPAKIMEQMESAGHLLELIVELVLEFGRRFAEKKLDEGVMDFSDMEHFALNILVKRDSGKSIPTATALELSEWFHEIMTDEYQDSNSVQEEILDAISGESRGVHNRFMVGDVKQGIYRFRKARPQIILDKMQTYTLDGADNRRIDLKQNFRSRSQVLDIVNDIFQVAMRPEVGGVTYDEAARLNLGASYYTVTDETDELYKPQLMLLELPDADSQAAREKQAEYIAGLVEQYVGKLLVSSEEKDENDRKLLRPARYSDIAILYRSVRKNASALTEAFARKQIPLYINTSGGYYASIEVAQVIDYLRALDNPRQDIPLFTAMVSPMGGFSDSQIAMVRAKCSEGCLWEVINKYANQDDGDEKLKEQLQKFIARVNEYRALITIESVQHIIGRIYDDSGYLNYVEAMPDGVSRRANAELLLQKAGSFEENGGGSIFSFIKYIEHLKIVNKDEEETGIVDANADVVRVFTIHGSKGLEYPICIVADVCAQINKRDSSAKFMIDMDLGVAIKHIDPRARLKSDTLLRQVIARKNDVDTNGEELRLLYVAMTRAQEKLVLVGTTKDAQADIEYWKRMWDFFPQGVPSADIADAGSYMDFIMMGLESRSEDITVITCEDMQDMEIDSVVEATQRQMDVITPSPDMLGQSELVDILLEQFDMKYASPQLSGLKTKWSVSELKAMDYEAAIEKETRLAQLDSQAEPDSEWGLDLDVQRDDASHGEPKSYIPSFARKEGENGPVGTDYGTAHHRIMELLDLSRAQSVDDIKNQVTDFAGNGLIPDSYNDIISYSKILGFVTSDLGQRMMKAQKAGLLHVEQQFFLGVPADLVTPELNVDETVLIQGIIDAFWEEEDGIVILDYKTDRVSKVEELLDRYATQMRYYARAVAAGMARPVKEALFYSFKLGETVAVEL